jgi:hypothetical protein
MKELIGRKINRIFLNEDKLKFDTDNGILIYTVEGDCCSHSVFYDFYGVKNLIGSVVKNVEEVELHPKDIEIMKDECGFEIHKDKKSYQEYISVYGYRVTTEKEGLGEVSSVVSFRNYSNGYYGGYLLEPTMVDETVLPEIFDDVVDTFKLE